MSIDIKFNPTPDPDNWVIKKFLAKCQEDRFVDLENAGVPYTDRYSHTPVENPKWVELHEKGEMIGGYWDCGGFQCSDEFMQKLLVHPVVKDSVFTGVWIDEALEYDEQVKPKKQKPKHTQPFWTKNWRKK